MKQAFLVFVLVLLAGCSGSDRLGTERVASADGLSVAYSSQGDGSPAVVLIHGWSGDRGIWSNQIDALAARYRVIALDLGGHGESGTRRPGWPLAAFGADVQAVVESLAPARVVVVGHSMGAFVALDAARRMPGRVIGVVAVDSLNDADFEWDVARFGEFVGRFEQDFAGMCAGFVEGMFVSGADPSLVGRVRDGMCDAPPDVATTLLRQFPDYDLRRAMRALEVPLRCINGSLFPTRVETNRKYVADFRAVVLDGVGHFPMLEVPDEFNRHLLAAIEEIAMADSDIRVATSVSAPPGPPPAVRRVRRARSSSD